MVLLFCNNIHKRNTLSSIFFKAFLRDATLTALSKSSVNIEVVAGSGPQGHPKIWEIKREDWTVACTVNDHAHLKDCTVYGARQGRNHFRIGGRKGTTQWVPQNAYKNTLTSDRTSLSCL